MSNFYKEHLLHEGVFTEKDLTEGRRGPLQLASYAVTAYCLFQNPRNSKSAVVGTDTLALITSARSVSAREMESTSKGRSSPM
jgi:hypothetical protein